MHFAFLSKLESDVLKTSCQGCGTICETGDFLGRELPKRAKEQEKRGAKLKQALCAAGVNLAAFAMFAIRASKAGKRARKTRAEAQTSFMRGRREFGGVRNVCDICIV